MSDTPRTDAATKPGFASSGVTVWDYEELRQEMLSMERELAAAQAMLARYKEAERELPARLDYGSTLDYIDALRAAFIAQKVRADILQKLLVESRQYVSDAGSDEDSETQRLSRELVAAIDAALAAGKEK